MSALFRWDQLCNVTHDLVPDLIQLLAVLLAASLRIERAERFADIDLDPGAPSTLAAGENLIQADQTHG